MNWNKQCNRSPTKNEAFMKKFILIFGLLIPTIGFTQSYSINWYKVAGGGGTSSGGNYSISGTIGQPDASGAMTGGGYSLTGGFWSLIAVVQSTGLPNLTITHSGNTVIISWPDTGSYLLQQNSNLKSGSWGASGYSITTSNGTNSVVVTSPTGSLFFRLYNP
jgi:hypothetical protein